MKLSGQVRTSSGMGIHFHGYDFVAALALGDALGMCRMSIAELLPDVEQVVMRKINEQVKDAS